MDLPSGLASHLRDLVESIGIGDDDVSGSLVALIDSLRTAVSSYMGLQITLVLDQWPVTLTAFGAIDGHRPTTSLRLSLSYLDAGFDPQSRIVFYAASAGAFVDLAADLEYLDRMHARQPVVNGANGDGNGHPPVVRLDADLPPETVVSGLSGLTEYATINRAVGVLVQRGHRLDDAQAELRRAASASGLALPDYAARLLEG